MMAEASIWNKPERMDIRSGRCCLNKNFIKVKAAVKQRDVKRTDCK